MNFMTTCLLIFLSCSFEACLLEVQSLSALLLPINMLPCQYIPIIVSVCSPLRSYMYFSKRGLMKSVHMQLAIRKSFEDPPTLPQIDFSLSLARNLYDGVAT